MLCGEAKNSAVSLFYRSIFRIQGPYNRHSFGQSGAKSSASKRSNFHAIVEKVPGSNENIFTELTWEGNTKSKKLASGRNRSEKDTGFVAVIAGWFTLWISEFIKAKFNLGFGETIELQDKFEDISKNPNSMNHPDILILEYKIRK